MTTTDHRASWGRVAAGWERRRGLLAQVGAPVTEKLVELLDPQDGEHLLEVACGPGEVGHAAAAALGRGRLLQSDLVPEMVAAARREAEALGLANVEHATVDMQAIPLEDDAVDGVLSRWGVMLCPDPKQALTEIARVVRPRGRVALAVWAEPERNPWGTLVTGVLVELGLVEPPDPLAPGPFALGRLERLSGLLDAAGLEGAVVEEVELTWPYRSPADFWEVALDLSGMLGTWLATAAPADAERVRDGVLERLRAWERDDGTVPLPGVSRVLLARPR